MLGMDDLDASYEALTRAIEASRLSAPPPRCAPSRLLETAEPNPERLRAAAADKSLDSVREIMGETWTNRMAALLPAGCPPMAAGAVQQAAPHSGCPRSSLAARAQLIRSSSTPSELVAAGAAEQRKRSRVADPAAAAARSGD